jgi:hypothetical protein
MTKPFTRLDVEAFAQMLLAARHDGQFHRGHGEGARDAAFGRTYAERRSLHTDRDEYDLGFRVGRFILFAKLPAWRAPMITHKDSQEWWARFQASSEGRSGD